MSAGHTKGPWRVGKCGMSIVADYPIEGGVRGTNDVEAEGGHLVAETVAKVNVLLLIAAPEMLSLLQELIDIEGPQPGTSAWAKKVQDLIAKATGEKNGI